MSASTEKRRQSPELQAALCALEQLLRAQLESHQTLLKCIERKREAISVADVDSINAMCQKENAIAQRLAQQENKRQWITRELSTAPAEDPLTVTQVAEQADEPQRTRLLALAGQLREAVTAVKRESSIVRAAADALSRHLGGLMESMRAAIGKAGTYGRRGRLALDAQPYSSVDMKL